MLRTRVYIDGYNFYYGCLKGTSHKWLDLVKLFKYKVLPSITAQSNGVQLRPDLENLSIKYFTTRRPYTKPISWYPRPDLIAQALQISSANGMKSSDVYKWLQQPNPYWGQALPLDMLSNEKDGQKVLDFMTHWHGSRSTSFDPSSP
ncbi:DUF2384 domain-containing protein [Limnohabitans sp. 15K]|uniref:DUF2384 domain-containing protein n=1 Tax=Limnohabitans sp. 15K TaxID=1100706 RepID=UPI000C1EF848|nr:DUF2384 domain-containing protein [Limnohabitans sp. 15K]PIT82772.1 hypothetical protein B9Z40_03445 [Limnohabitans sp. 15K]